MNFERDIQNESGPVQNIPIDRWSARSREHLFGAQGFNAMPGSNRRNPGFNSRFRRLTKTEDAWLQHDAPTLGAHKN